MLYQPQPESWKAYTLFTARMAVAITPPGKEEFVGTVMLSAETKTDHERRVVVWDNLKFYDAKFPALDEARSRPNRRPRSRRRSASQPSHYTVWMPNRERRLTERVDADRSHCGVGVHGTGWWALLDLNQ